MESNDSVKTDFSHPRMGSAYSVMINEGAGQALSGMLYRNPYTDATERAAFEFGRESGLQHVKAISR